MSENLKTWEMILQQVIDTIPSRIFWKDKNFKYLGCNKSFAEHFQYSKEDIIGKDDHEMGWVMEEYADLFRRDDEFVIGTGESKLNFEDKSISITGESIWVNTSKIPLYDSDNNIYGLLGISDDITVKKEIEVDLQLAKLRHEQLAKKSSSVVWEVDIDGLFTYISPVAEEVFGYSPEEIINEMHIYNSFNIENKDSYKKMILSMIKNKETIDGIEIKYKNKNNEDVWVLTNGLPVKDKMDQLLVYRGMFNDITYLKKIEEEIMDLSFRDSLTGLNNRRFFVEELRRLDTKRNLPLTAVMIDVDGLKLVNDTFGHDAGDLLLKKTADILVKECRADDIISRLGGDEFIILLPKTSSEEAKVIVERIHKQVRKERIEAVNLSISYGINTKNEESEIIQDIFKIADIEMYHKKIKKKRKLRNETVETILERLFERNPEEKQHSQNVSELSVSIGNALNLPIIEIEKLKSLGKFHDIGKIVISSDLLMKKEKLTNWDLREIRRHPESGYVILSSSDEFVNFAKETLYHHESYDGKGYPYGLKGEDIPLNSRIIALANSYDSMTSDRYGRKGLSKMEAIDFILKESGKQFDPEIVTAFLSIDLP